MVAWETSPSHTTHITCENIWSSKRRPHPWGGPCSWARAGSKWAGGDDACHERVRPSRTWETSPCCTTREFREVIVMVNVALPHSLEEAMECEGEVVAHVHLDCCVCGKRRPFSLWGKCGGNGNRLKRRPHLVRHQLCDQEPHPIGERMCGEDPRDDLWLFCSFFSNNRKFSKNSAHKMAWCAEINRNHGFQIESPLNYPYRNESPNEEQLEWM